MAEGAALRDVGRSRFARLSSPIQSDGPDTPSSVGTSQDQLGVDYPDLSIPQPPASPAAPTIQDQTVVPANDAGGIQKVTLPVVVPSSQPIAAAPSPATHHFDPAKWLEGSRMVMSTQQQISPARQDTTWWRHEWLLHGWVDPKEAAASRAGRNAR